MAIVITKRHKNKQLSNRQWIKTSISLTIVMGIGWLANVLFFSDKLLFIAYIMSVFIAGQGIIIFILYVPLSKHVSLIIVTSENKYHTYYYKHTGKRGILKMVA